MSDSIDGVSKILLIKRDWGSFITHGFETNIKGALGVLFDSAGLRSYKELRKEYEDFKIECEQFLQNKLERDTYLEGQEAFLEGDGDSENPYKPNTIEYDCWLRGYSQAEAEDAEDRHNNAQI